LVQVRGGAEFKTAGILTYFEVFRPTNKNKFDGSSSYAGKRGTNKEIGLKDFFEIASNQVIGTR
jgi:hypothetical protein